jgi:hypothetical protein
MSPQVDLDADVFEYLKSKAEPFVDTPSTVLRRLLGLAEPSQASEGAKAFEPRLPTANPRAAARKTSKKHGGHRPRTRAAAGTILPEDQYVQPLLRALDKAGGRAPYREIADAVGSLMKDQFLPADLELLDSGGVRWQSRLQFVRLRLVERGLLERNSPRGIWELSDAGHRALKEGYSDQN